MNLLPDDTLDALVARAVDRRRDIDVLPAMSALDLSVQLMEHPEVLALRQAQGMRVTHFRELVELTLQLLDSYLPSMYNSLRRAQGMDEEEMWHHRTQGLDVYVRARIRVMFTRGGFRELFAPELEQQPLGQQAVAASTPSVTGQGGKAATPAATGQAAAAASPPADAAGRPAAAPSPVPAAAKHLVPTNSRGEEGRRQHPPAAPRTAAAPGAPGGSGDDEDEDRGSQPRSPGPGRQPDRQPEPEEGEVNMEAPPDREERRQEGKDTVFTFMQWSKGGVAREKKAIIRMTMPEYSVIGNIVRSTKHMQPMFTLALPTTPYPEEGVRNGLPHVQGA